MAKRRTVKKKFTEDRYTCKPPQAMTEAQGHLLIALESTSQVITTGCAGTGKTYIPTAYAAYLLRQKEIDKIILTRPNVASGPSLGFFPGELEEKMAPWVVPFTEILKQQLGTGAYESALKLGNIEVVPFETMRGRTFDRAFIILDEAQNTTPEQMKMFLTRVGQWSRVVIDGDLDQTDIKTENGLGTIISMINRYGLPVSHINFTTEDIVRSDICKQWIIAFNKVATGL